MQFSFSFFDDAKEVSLCVHLSTGGFFYRLKVGIKYIFGHRSRFGDWDEIIIDKTNYLPLKKIIDFIEKE